MQQYMFPLSPCLGCFTSAWTHLGTVSVGFCTLPQALPPSPSLPTCGACGPDQHTSRGSVNCKEIHNYTLCRQKIFGIRHGHFKKAREGYGDGVGPWKLWTVLQEHPCCPAHPQPELLYTWVSKCTVCVLSFRHHWPFLRPPESSSSVICFLELTSQAVRYILQQYLGSEIIYFTWVFQVLKLPSRVAPAGQLRVYQCLVLSLLL